jgi:hypothetical protein|tara:strand:- start:1149 stop:1451 length:303 start_codon:yes stop_codon:yes gene_type:complete
MNKYKYRVRVSSKLACNNRYGLGVNGSTKSKPIYELINLYPKELWKKIYSKEGSSLSISLPCYNQLEKKIKIVAPELIEEIEKKKRIIRAQAKARKYYKL